MFNSAAHVFALALGIDVAVGGIHFSAEPIHLLDRAAGGCVQCHFIMSIVIRAFEDIDFASFGPFPAVGEHPKCRPCPADSAGAVFDVEDEEAVVIGSLG